MSETQYSDAFINDAKIEALLHKNQECDPVRIREILDKGKALSGLSLSEVAELLPVKDPDLLSELFSAANKVKNDIYGRRLVIFAPLYISNLCSNECLYCAFRASNRDAVRRALTMDEIAAETKSLVEQGHKRVLMVAGELYSSENGGFDYILNAIKTIYSVKSGPGEIRRVNVNVAPLTIEEFGRLNEAGIGTYQLFQETYHRGTYAKVHIRGKKSDYTWRVTAIDRAMSAGIDDCGVGPLFGLYKWEYEVLALMMHIRHLEKTFGVGPHTISVPRIEPATGSDMSAAPPYPVSDDDFRKIVAVLRLAVPYTGIIMSTRESEDMRRELFSLGVSQISGGSRTNPGGYGSDASGEGVEGDSAQFQIGDRRTLDEVIRDAARMGLVPSFCTGCYRLGRTGKDFMDLAKPGAIKRHCDPNALSTFMEYLMDYGSSETKVVGEELIETALGEMEAREGQSARLMVEKVKSGDRDVYC